MTCGEHTQEMHGTDLVHEHDDEILSCEDTDDEEIPYVYVASDEDDVYIYSDDDCILSDVSDSYRDYINGS